MELGQWVLCVVLCWEGGWGWGQSQYASHPSL